MWRQHLAPQVVGHTEARVTGVLKPSGAGKGTGTYTTWLDRGWDRQLADAAVAEVVARWQADDNPGWAMTVANDAFDLGCRHPDVVRLVAETRADPGTADNLQAAVALVDAVLDDADGSTHPGWRRLAQHHRLLAGQLRRSRGIDTGELDAGGNPVYVPRHHPTNPRRPPHPDRFTL